MDKITALDRAMRYAPSFLALPLLAVGLVAGMSGAQADPCRFTTCGAQERIFGTRPLFRDDLGNRGGRSWNDIYNQRNQPRFKPGVKAEPFDMGSPIDPTIPLAKGDKTEPFRTNDPQARNEHMRWCRQHYRSYVGASDTYTTFDGRTLFCNSPYD